MYLGECAIDQYLTFAVGTMQPAAYDAGGGAVDADSPPAYRIYEEETATPILTGTMAKLDDANTLGFYTERVQLTAASGFEENKFYTIYISYEVSAVVVTKIHSLQVRAASGADPQINYIYDRVGIPVALDGGSPTVSSMLTKMADDNGGLDFDASLDSLNAIGADAQLINEVYGRQGEPVSLGETEGSPTHTGMLLAMAGKADGAPSYNRLYDSQEALSDTEADNVSMTDMKNLLFKRNVTARHPNDKPQTIEAGVGDSFVTITTTLDGVATEQIKTEDYS